MSKDYLKWIRYNPIALARFPTTSFLALSTKSNPTKENSYSQFL